MRYFLFFIHPVGYTDQFETGRAKEYSHQAPSLQGICRDVSTADISLSGAACVFREQLIKPFLQLSDLAMISPVSDQFHPTAQLTNSDDRKKDPRVFVGHPLEECANTVVGLRSLTHSADDIRIPIMLTRVR